MDMICAEGDLFRPWRRHGWTSAWVQLLAREATWNDSRVAQAHYDEATSELERAAIRIAHHLATEPLWGEHVRKDVDWPVLEDAGFFDDGAAPESVAAWFTAELQPEMSPWPDIQSGHRSDNDVMMLATGAFAPVHEGHLAMMEAACVDARHRGFDVRAVIFSPCHDIYVAAKPGAVAWTASARIDQLQRSVQPLAARLDAPVLVDPWEALGVDVPVNFTTVIRRWRLAWEKQYPAFPCRVGLVVGSDHAGFSRIARATQPVWVVRRPGWEVSDLPPHAYKVGGFSVSSSRCLREAGASPIATRAACPPGAVAWRDDLFFALAPWARKVPAQALHASGRRWRNRVVGELSNALSPSPLHRIDVPSQQRWLARLNRRHKVINLDPVTGGTMSSAIGGSRYFRPADGQWQGVHGPRPDAESDVGGAPLEPGAYWLVDDDIVSGGTMLAAESRLPAHVRVCGRLSLLAAHLRQHELTLLDVLDLRDFLPGSRGGGLVLRFPDGSKGRLPYMAPYVNLVARASILPSDALPLSERLWAAATEFFHSLPETLLLSDGSPAFTSALKHYGLDMSMPMSSWCQEQAEACRMRARRDGMTAAKRAGV